MTNQDSKRYFPEEVPDHLFTQNKLNRMGLAPATEDVAFVTYPEQKREYKLFDVNNTRKRKKQKWFNGVYRKIIVSKADEREYEEV